jgi:PTH1 family peptidyl-tRNA hydrolase
MGHRVVDRLAGRWGVTLRHRKDLGGLAWTSEGRFHDVPVILAKPSTYMNRSGRAAAVLAEHYGLDPADLIVIYDDADLDLGRIRIRPGGGAGGHNGVQDLMDTLTTGSFPRVRLGVRGEDRESSELAEYVLSDFEPEEEAVAERLVDLGAEATEAILKDGLQTAMNGFNGRSVREAEESEAETTDAG